MRNFVPDDSRIMTFDFQIEQVETTHFHQSIEVFYVLEGNPSVTVQDEVYQMHPEDVLVINANKKHSYRSSDEVLIGYVEINFRMLGDLLGTDHLFFWCNSVLNKTAAYDDLRSALKKIFGQYFDRSGYGKVALQGMYYELLEVLIGSFMVSSDDRRFEEEHSQDEQRVQEIVNYIHSNYRKKISLQELGDALYLSVPYLSKYIKRKMGMNFVDYVNNIRLFHAVDDLLYTNNSITSIALENGFPNVASLTRMLKTAYNMTPSEYRQKMKDSGSGDQSGTKGHEKEALKRRVTDYLDNRLVQEPQDLDYGDSYIVTDTEQRESYDRFWNRMINIGRMEDLLRSDMQEQIRTLHDELGFIYVRVWDFMGGSMLLDRAGNKGEYNFNRVDSAFEFLIRNGLKPYLELGLKPKQLYSTLNRSIYVEKRVSPFENEKQYESFLNSFLTHLINHFGMEEVETWYFEQWCGEDFENETYDRNFWNSFEILYRVAKKHSAAIRTGGGGIGIQYGRSGLENLVAGWEKRRIRPDFITLYCYPYIRGDEDGSAYARQSTDRDFLKNQLEMAGQIIKNSALCDTEIHVTEWSSTISNRNILNDSCFKGAYIMKGILDTFGRGKMLGYWVGSDIFSEHVDSDRLLYGGCGLMTVKGIKKPAFYAYRFMNMLGRYLLYRDSNCAVTTNGNNNYSIVCHNYRHLNYRYFLKKEDELEQEKLYQLFEDSQALHLNYQLTHVKNGKYKIKTYSVNDDHGSIQKELERAGGADQVTGREVEYLKRICTPHIAVRTCQVKKNVLNFETVMQAQEIQYIHISYLYE